MIQACEWVVSVCGKRRSLESNYKRLKISGILFFLCGKRRSLESICISFLISTSGFPLWTCRQTIVRPPSVYDGFKVHLPANPSFRPCQSRALRTLLSVALGAHAEPGVYRPTKVVSTCACVNIAVGEGAEGRTMVCLHVYALLP